MRSRHAAAISEARFRRAGPRHGFSRRTNVVRQPRLGERRVSPGRRDWYAGCIRGIGDIHPSRLRAANRIDDGVRDKGAGGTRVPNLKEQTMLETITRLEPETK